MFMFFLFKQKTAYEMRISDWSSDVCSSDLLPTRRCSDRAVVEGEVGTELRVDVDEARFQVGARDRIGQRRAVPGVRDDARGEVREHECRAGRTQHVRTQRVELRAHEDRLVADQHRAPQVGGELGDDPALFAERGAGVAAQRRGRGRVVVAFVGAVEIDRDDIRSEEHTSELQSLMRISYAVFCLKKKKYK